MTAHQNSWLWVGAGVMLFGALAMMVNYNVVTLNLNLLKFWPAILIFIGIELILRYFFPDPRS